MANKNPNSIDLRKREKSLSMLSNLIRLKILYLLKNTKEKISFNQIADKLSIDKNKLSYHIALLKNNNFISNEIRPNKTGRTFSFYHISKKGENAIESIEKINKDNEDNLNELENL